MNSTDHSTHCDAVDELKGGLSAQTILRAKEPLAKRTTLRVGGYADFYAEPAAEEDLGKLFRYCLSHNLPHVILGRGSNLLIKDRGVRGMVISLTHAHFSAIDAAGHRLHCGAGARLKQVALEARRYYLTGMEFLEGIPGTVGGALRMNAGAMGSWTFDVVESVRYMDEEGQVCERPAAELQAQYRGCAFLKTKIALGAIFLGHPAAREVVEKRMQSFSEKRWASQPSAPSAGCIFKNPAEIPAGKLIDELGLKGSRVGGAVVSAEHGNFIVNDGGATARDVLELIEVIRARARKDRGIDLELEVEVIGE